MLELYEAEGAFGRVEAYLRDAGLFGGGATGVVADLYLGYRLGQQVSRTIVQHLSAPFRGDPNGLARVLEPLRPRAPRPLSGDGWTIASASPEIFLARRGDRVLTMPVKGTRSAGSPDDLRDSEKDAAEHVMIVDLERNDLSRVCEPGTEIEESWVKARPLLAAIGSPRPEVVRA